MWRATKCNWLFRFIQMNNQMKFYVCILAFTLSYLHPFVRHWDPYSAGDSPKAAVNSPDSRRHYPHHQAFLVLTYSRCTAEYENWITLNKVHTHMYIHDILVPRYALDPFLMKVWVWSVLKLILSIQVLL